MTAQPPENLSFLFRELVDAAKSLNWHPNSDPRIHHNNSREFDNERDWEHYQQETGRIVFPESGVFHLQIRLERLGNDSRHRVVIFGRQVKGLAYATPNTQRATFNSDHLDDAGYWVRPNLDTDEKNKMAKRLPGPTFPQWNGQRIHLGSELPYITLRRFLIALAVIEQVKGGWPSAPLPFQPELLEDLEEFEARDLADLAEIEEGKVGRFTGTRRRRCQRLMGEAWEYFRSLSPDGRLRCQICNWYPLVPTRGKIIQLHHVKQLCDYPPGGHRLTLKAALDNLAPLCPNCHRILESHPSGGCYTLDELIKHLRAK